MWRDVLCTEREQEGACKRHAKCGMVCRYGQPHTCGKLQQTRDTHDKNKQKRQRQKLAHRRKIHTQSVLISQQHCYCCDEELSLFLSFSLPLSLGRLLAVRHPIHMMNTIVLIGASSAMLSQQVSSVLSADRKIFVRIIIITQYTHRDRGRRDVGLKRSRDQHTNIAF